MSICTFVLATLMTNVTHFENEEIKRRKINVTNSDSLLMSPYTISTQVKDNKSIRSKERTKGARKVKARLCNLLRDYLTPSVSGG